MILWVGMQTIFAFSPHNKIQIIFSCHGFLARIVTCANEGLRGEIFAFHYAMELLWQWQWGARGFQRSHFLTIAFTHIRMIVIYLCKYSRESSGIAPNGVEQLDTWKGTWEPPKNVIIIFNSFLARYIIHSIFIGTQNHEKKRHFMIVGESERELGRSVARQLWCHYGAPMGISHDHVDCWLKGSNRL